MSHTGIIIGECTELNQLANDLQARADEKHEILHALEQRRNNNEVLTTEESAKMAAIENALASCEAVLISMRENLQAQIANLNDL